MREKELFPSWPVWEEEDVEAESLTCAGKLHRIQSAII
jgi:hypothetical protein